MACLNKTPALPTNLRVFLLLSRGKTTRPQEWKDKSRFQVKIHPDQVPVEETWNSGRQKWVDVRWKNKNSAETLIHTMAMDETRRSDPHEARRISDAKLTALRSSLMAKGYVLMQYTPCAHSGHRFCRERKSYDPPDDVENVIKNAFETAVQPQSPADSWIDFKLTDLKIKFKVRTVYPDRSFLICSVSVPAALCLPAESPGSQF